MAILRFTLSEDGVSVLRDALACLGKFSDEVSLEAKKDKVRDSASYPMLRLLAAVYPVYPVLRYRLLL
jgi:hypothetical protein